MDNSTNMSLPKNQPMNDGEALHDHVGQHAEDNGVEKHPPVGTQALYRHKRTSPFRVLCRLAVSRPGIH